MKHLAEALRQARHVAVYTGAGISTVQTSLFPVFLTWQTALLMEVSNILVTFARLLPSRITAGLTECGLSCRRGALSGEWVSERASAKRRSSAYILALDVLSHAGWRNHSLLCSLSTRHSDLSEAEPTLTHMCIQMLHKVKLVSARESRSSPFSARLTRWLVFFPFSSHELQNLVAQWSVVWAGVA